MGIEGSKLDHEKLEEITARRGERLRLVDDEQTDGGNVSLQNRFVDGKIGLLDRRQKNVHVIVEVLRAIAVIAVDEDAILLADFLQVPSLLLQKSDEGKNDQTLTMPKQEASKHENLVHQRLADTCRRRVHEVLPFEDRIVVNGQHFRLPGKKRRDVVSVVVRIDDSLRDSIKPQIIARILRTNLQSESSL